MPHPDTDRNLLFLVLALQAEHLTPGRFIEAWTLWAARQDTPVAPLLAERGWLAPEGLADVERLLDHKLKEHAGDAHAGLVELTQDHQLRPSIEALADPDVRASLLLSPPPVGHVLLSTPAPAPQGGERYTITRLHATGGIGRVWLAHDDTLGRDVALKELRPEQAGNPAVWGRFLKEAQITGQLEHPGIVPIYELGRRPQTNQPFYTMRFVRGLTLREKIAAYHQKRQTDEPGRLELRELLTAFVGVCNAVAYAHSKGVIHRDLKPANVVLGEFGEVMVLDWGLAKAGVGDPDPGAGPGETATAPAPLSAPEERTTPSGPSSGPGEPPSATLEGQVLGTPAYMAPEQAEGRLADIDARTDVYGLGAILYELLTGCPPFSGGGTAEVLHRVRTLAPDRPCSRVPGTPRALEAICLRALARRPADRYPGAKALADDVQRFLADEPTTAYREPLAARAWRWARRHRTLTSTLVAALAVAVPILVTGVILLKQSQTRERQARERAQANYQRSLRAADALAEELARGIRPIAGTQSKTVLEILDRTRQITDELLSDADAPPEALERKARILGQFAQLYRDTNRTGPSRHSAEQAIALWDRLLRDRPEDRPLRLERAKARLWLGEVLFEQLYFEEALAAFRESLTELQAVGAGADPRLASNFLASGYTWVGNVLLMKGDDAGAEEAYRRGLEIRREAVAALKGNLALGKQLALSLERYGRFLVTTNNQRRDEGLGMVRQGRAAMEAACAADPWDSSLHLQLVRLLTNLAELTRKEAEAVECVEAAQKVVDRFQGRDPEHMQWQREGLRVPYHRIGARLKLPSMLPPDRLQQLRAEEGKVLRDLLVVIERLVAHDPENFMWRKDQANVENRLAQSYLFLAQQEQDPHLSAAHLAKARALALSSQKLYEPVLARCPGIPEVETDSIAPLFTRCQIEAEAKDVPAALVARWGYEAQSLAFLHRYASAYPTNQRAQRLLANAYVRIGYWLEYVAREPAWARALGRPDVLQAYLRLAAVAADFPEGLANEFHDEILEARQLVGKLLRALDAKRLLPAEGKKLLDRLPAPGD